MGVLGGWAFSYERGTPVALAEGKRDGGWKEEMQGGREGGRNTGGGREEGSCWGRAPRHTGLFISNTFTRIHVSAWCEIRGNHGKRTASQADPRRRKHTAQKMFDSSSICSGVATWPLTEARHLSEPRLTRWQTASASARAWRPRTRPPRWALPAPGASAAPHPRTPRTIEARRGSSWPRGAPSSTR